jgi:hypothetical protein
VLEIVIYQDAQRTQFTSWIDLLFLKVNDDGECCVTVIREGNGCHETKYESDWLVDLPAIHDILDDICNENNWDFTVVIGALKGINPYLALELGRIHETNRILKDHEYHLDAMISKCVRNAVYEMPQGISNAKIFTDRLADYIKSYLQTFKRLPDGDHIVNDHKVRFLKIDEHS